MNDRFPIVRAFALVLALGAAGRASGAWSRDQASWSAAPWSVQRVSDLPANLRGVRFAPDGLNGWITGAGVSPWDGPDFTDSTSDALILHTSDGGTSWQEQVSGVHGDLRAVHAFDDRVAAAAGDALVLTDDGGRSWTAASAPSLPAEMRAVWMLDPQVALIAALGGLYRTADGGASVLPVPETANEDLTFDAIFFLDALHGWAAALDASTATGDTSSYLIFATSDAQSWVQVGSATVRADYPGAAADLWFRDGATGILAGHGAFMRTTDGGATWADIAELEPPIDLAQVRPGGLDFLDDTRGVVALGRAGTVYGTEDGGESWTAWAQSHPRSPLNGVAYPSQGSVLAVGDGGVIARSTNGGVTWMTDASGDAAAMVDVAFASQSIAYAAGRTTLLKSTDGGVSWIDLTLNLGAVLAPATLVPAVARLSAPVEDVVFAWAQSATLFRSTDGGASFEERNGAVDCADGLAFASASVGWCRSDDAIQHSTDGGATWSEALAGFSGGGDLVATDTDKAWAANGAGRIARLADDGTWKVVHVEPGASFEDIAFSGASIGAVVGSSSLSTSSGGVLGAWSPFAPPVSRHVALAAAAHWLVGGVDALFASTDGGASWASLARSTDNALINALASDGAHRSAAASRRGLLELHTDQAPPADLRARVTAEGAVELSWTRSAQADVAGYRVYRSTRAGTGFALLGDGQTTEPNYLDASAAPGVSHYYVVTSVCIGGSESGYSRRAFARVSERSGEEGRIPLQLLRLVAPDGADRTQDLSCEVDGDATRCCLPDAGGGSYRLDVLDSTHVSIHAATCSLGGGAARPEWKPGDGARPGRALVSMYRPEGINDPFVLELGSAIPVTAVPANGGLLYALLVVAPAMRRSPGRTGALRRDRETAARVARQRRGSATIC